MSAELPPIAYGTFYHIYNRGNNRENIFPQERNYAYFMDLWWKHISPIAETWAYGLLRNHFHAAVFIKRREDLSGLKSGNVRRETGAGQNAIPADSREDLTGLKEPSRYFSNFFNAYARGVNIAVQRTGALFQRPFKRIPVENSAYLMRLIVYIHQNPQKHGFESDFRNWNYSSYHQLISDHPTRLEREKILQLFGSRADFIRIHQEIEPLTGFDVED
jgi:putative transposase